MSKVNYTPCVAVFKGLNLQQPFRGSDAIFHLQHVPTRFPSAARSNKCFQGVLLSVR